MTREQLIQFLGEAAYTKLYLIVCQKGTPKMRAAMRQRVIFQSDELEEMVKFASQYV